MVLASNAISQAVDLLETFQGGLDPESAKDVQEVIDLLKREYCLVCGLPDNCGDCDHGIACFEPEVTLKLKKG